MRNKIYLILFLALISNLSISNSLNSEEIFNFNITELEITNDGTVFTGSDGGEVYTNDGTSVTAENFEFNKITSLLVASNNAKLVDTSQDIVIFANKISYNKNHEEIKAEGKVLIIDNKKKIKINSEEIIYLKNKKEVIAKKNVNFIDQNKKIYIEADEIYYFKNKEKLLANNNVLLEDKIKNIQIKTDQITYQKKLNRFFASGKTEANIDNNYQFLSEDVFYTQNEMRIYSSKNTKIKDFDGTLYELESFDYNIEKEFLKGIEITIIENSNLEIKNSDKYYFANGFFDLKNKKFKTGQAEIKLKKNIFDRSENDPRLYGVSVNHENKITTVKKAVFTSCKINDSCPPWRIEASEIKHDKNKKQLIYENSILKVYDFPIFYFPKFFHPDPTVERQSGFLIPKFNTSNVLGSSLRLPYFNVISENKDITFNPTIFSKDIFMLQTEYRQENKNSSLISDFGIANGYSSSSTQKEKDIYHIFANLKKNFNLESFLKSDFNFFLERTNRDTYLKVFSNNLTESDVRPKNPDVLNSGFDFILEHEKYSLLGGADVYEDLTKPNSDKYQFVLPYYDYVQNAMFNNFGTYQFNSSGNNILDNTNNIRSRIINDFSVKLNDNIFESLGLKNNFNFFFKNQNSIGKNVDTYKSSPQIKLRSLMELKSEIPLIKKDENNIQTLIPRASFRINPSDMKNYSNESRRINTSNIFDMNRLGLDDTLEAGNSLTIGIDYSKQNIKKNNQLLDFKLATVLRDKQDNNIPTLSSINEKNSNLFGSLDYKLSSIFNVDYNFAIDNKIDKFNYNSIGLDISLNNFITEFNFIEEDADIGNTNFFENSSTYNFNNQNSISFKTRRNRELNLTEYYNLVYEYKNDCLTAGIRFNKTYYEDRDLKPTENLMFTISFYPITSVEQSIN